MAEVGSQTCHYQWPCGIFCIVHKLGLLSQTLLATLVYRCMPVSCDMQSDTDSSISRILSCSSSVLPKESILQEWLLKLKLCTDFALKHRWRPKIKKIVFTLIMVS